MPPRTEAVMDRGIALLAEIRAARAPDPRWAVFELSLEEGDDGISLTGEASSAEAVQEAVASLAGAGITVQNAVTMLPDPGLGGDRHALVAAALAPLYAIPGLPAPQISQLVLGMRVEILSRRDVWRRIRGEDGYLGWIHHGYLAVGPEDWAKAWERGSAGEPVVSLGAELVGEDGEVLSRLPWGARLIRHSGACQLPDGARGTVVNGEVVDIDRLADRFPARGESIVRTARRWLGAPYLWSGISPAGVDCSGFTQAVMWMHGIALPRDSDMQAVARAGVQVPTDYAGLRAGDLLFFADPGDRVSHVGIGLGGSRFIHAAISNGAVRINDLAGDLPLEQRLAAMLVSVRRMLAD